MQPSCNTKQIMLLATEVFLVPFFKRISFYIVKFHFFNSIHPRSIFFLLQSRIRLAPYRAPSLFHVLIEAPEQQRHLLLYVTRSLKTHGGVIQKNEECMKPTQVCAGEDRSSARTLMSVPGPCVSAFTRSAHIQSDKARKLPHVSKSSVFLIGASCSWCK